MAKRNIITDGDPILRKKCRPVTEFNERIHTLLDDMAETMYAADGVGLAAPQVAVLRKVVVIDVGDGLIELINPEIVYESAECIEDNEGCLSFPGQYGVVKRPKKVTVKYQDRNGNWQEKTGEGLLARAFCHETDHLNGVCFVDLAEYMLEADLD